MNKSINKIGYFVSLFSLVLIPLIVWHYREDNLPPLIPWVRYFIIWGLMNLFLNYWILISEKNTERINTWLWILPIGAALALMHPLFSGDLMEYLIRGRMLGIYHVSPYIGLPKDFAHDILRPYSIWTKNPDAYGPLSVYLQTIPSLLCPRSVLGMIWIYKTIVLWFIALAIFYFKKMVKGDQAFKMFAYSPLLIVAGLLDGHNDLVMMSFSVISVYFLIEKKYTRAFFFWTCAFLVKYMVIIQLPFMVVYAAKDIGLKKIIREFLLNLFFVIACYAPVWGGLNTFLAIARLEGCFSTNSIPYIFYTLFHNGRLISWDNVPTIDQPLFKLVFGGLFFVIYIFLLYRFHRNQQYFFKAVALAYLAFYFCIPSALCYWYLTWALFWIILARFRNTDILVLIYTAIAIFAFYKRINFLCMAGVALYWLFVKFRKDEIEISDNPFFIV